MEEQRSISHNQNSSCSRRT